MKNLLIGAALFASTSLSSCVATTGDLRDLNASFGAEVARMSQSIDKSLAEQEKSFVALQAANNRLQEAQLGGASEQEVAMLERQLVELRAAYSASVSEATKAAQAAAQLAVDGFAGTVEDKISEIGARAEALQGDVAYAAQKAAEGPSGWLELLGVVVGTTAAGGVGLHKYRNATRHREMEGVEQRATGRAAQVAQGVAQGAFQAPPPLYQPPSPSYPPRYREPHPDSTGQAPPPNPLTQSMPQA